MTTCVYVILSALDSHEAERRQNLVHRHLSVGKLRWKVGIFLHEWNYYLLDAYYVPGTAHTDIKYDVLIVSPERLCEVGIISLILQLGKLRLMEMV